MSTRHKIFDKGISITTLAEWHVWLNQNTCLHENIEFQITVRQKAHYVSFSIVVYDSHKEPHERIMRYVNALDYVYWKKTHHDGFLDKEKALEAILEVEEFLMNGAK